jgi:hypothetical protein
MQRIFQPAIPFALLVHLLIERNKMNDQWFISSKRYFVDFGQERHYRQDRLCPACN